MSSILKVDTIQDQAGNNIINESGNVITIGASGDTITVPAGATVSGFTSAGIDDNATSVAITINSSEQVGIGTTSFDQDAKLTIAGSGSGGSNPSSISANTVATFRRTGGTSHVANISVLSGTTGASILNLGDRDDEDVGNIIYEHSSNYMAFTTNTSERMRILSDGKVGIGTSAPAGVVGTDKVLEIAGSTNPGLVINDTGQAEKYAFHALSTKLNMYYGTTAFFTFDASNSNTGIGTASPETTLHVSSGTANTVSLIESTDAYAWLSIKDNSSANSYINSIGASGDNLQIISKDITFRTSSAPNVSTGTYGTERMRIDSSGNTMFAKSTQGDVNVVRSRN